MNNTAPYIRRDGEVETTGGELKKIDLWSLVADAETEDPDLDFALESEISEQGHALKLVKGRRVKITPPVSFFGEDSFTYTVMDEGGLSATGTVNVTVLAADVTEGIAPPWDLSNISKENDAERGDVFDFDGTVDVDAPSRNDVNLLPITNRTWSVWFSADSVTNRQVLYEQGGGSRGVNIYLDEGQLVCGIWGMAGTNKKAYSSNVVNIVTWYHVALVLDGDNGTVTTYLNGKRKGTPALGGSLKAHQGGIGIGHVGLDGGDGKTMFSDESSFQDNQYKGFRYTGFLDDLRIYDSALNGNEVRRIFNAPAQ